MPTATPGSDALGLRARPGNRDAQRHATASLLRLRPGDAAQPCRSPGRISIDVRAPLTQSGEGCRNRGGDWIGVGSATNSPEAFPGYHDLPYYVTQATWSSPVSSRLLLDAGFSRFHYRFAGNGQVPPDGLTDLIPVTEQSTIYGLANFSYRGLYDPNAHAFADNKATSLQWRTTAAYVTGRTTSRSAIWAPF